MLKKTLPFVALCASLSAQAQTYDSLWKSVQNAQQKDLPKTTLTLLQKIHTKAHQEKNETQLLRYYLTESQAMEAISEDSLHLSLQRMEAHMERTTSPLLKALWQNALAKRRAQLYEDDPTENEKTRQLYLASISDFTLLATASAKDFLPLFQEGSNSEAFGQDLLHVLTYDEIANHPLLSDSVRFTLYGKLAAFYASRHRAGALLFSLRQWGESDPDRYEFENAPTFQEREAKLLQLKEEYADLAENLETYLTLFHFYEDATDFIPVLRQNRRSSPFAAKRYALLQEALAVFPNHPRINEIHRRIEEMTRSYLSISSANPTFLPHSPITLRLTERNVQQGGWRLRRVKGLSWLQVTEQFSTAQQHAALLPHTEIVPNSYHALAPQTAAPYEKVETTHTLQGLPAGIYLFELLQEKKVVDRSLFSVSAVEAVALSTGSGKRFTLVDAQTGAVLPQGSITEVSDRYARKKVQTSIPSNKQGEVFIPYDKDKQGYRYYPATRQDAFAANLPAYYFSYDTARPDTLHLTTFTDRSVYRPGQELHFSTVLYRQVADNAKVITQRNVTLTLRNPQGEVVDSQRVTTDAYGVGAGVFTLPQQGVWGDWSVEAESQGVRATAHYRVEAYKRPTLVATLNPPTVAYVAGDSITLTGNLKTYAGFTVADAKVRYRIEGFSWWKANLPEWSPQRGETMTDEKGNYNFSLRLPRPQTDTPFFCTVKVTLTAPSGETQETELTLPLSLRTSRLIATWQPRICKEELPTLTFYQQTALQKNIDTAGRYELRKMGKVVAQGHFRTGVPFVPELKNVPSGRYEVVTQVALSEPHLPEESRAWTIDTTEVWLFSEQDAAIDFSATGQSSLDKAKEQVLEADHHTPNNDFFVHERLSKDGRSLSLFLATATPTSTVFYDLVANNRIVHSERFSLSNRLTHLKLDYRAEWGDGVQVVLAFMKEGELSRYTTRLVRPLPEKKLVLQWKTFRSSLLPGQEEEWSLRVTHPDGTAAQASLLASMYDASLDAFAPHELGFHVRYPRHLPNLQVYSCDPRAMSVVTIPHGKNWRIPPLAFTQWQEDLFAPNQGRYRGELYALKAQVRMDVAATEEPESMAFEVKVRGAKKQHDANDMESPLSKNPLTATLAPAFVRKNFAETAFFLPTLRTNEQGEATLRFRLPESTTSWNFQAVAHTTTMVHGRLDTTIVARKEFTLSPSLPRFLREGDRTELPIHLHNLTQKAQKGRLCLVLLHAETMQEMHRQEQDFHLPAAGQASASFFVDTPVGSSGVLVRLTAEGKDFSDGEEHLLPVLSDLQEIMHTRPFTLQGRTSATIDVTPLWDKGARQRRLVVETTGNPLWQVAAALPFVYKVSPLNALDWVGQYHSTTLAAHLVQQLPTLVDLAQEDTHTTAAWSERLRKNPDLRALLLNETTWSPLARREAERTEKLRRLFDLSTQDLRTKEALDKLRNLRNGSDGGWSWYPGMHSNRWVTQQVVRVLLQGRQLTGNTTADDLLPAALAFLEKQVQQELRNKVRRLSYDQMEYLYVRALAKELGVSPLPASIPALLRLMKPQVKTYGMGQKALAAVTLSMLGERKEAEVALQSLLEHTVATPEMGRYFDTKRTRFWSSREQLSTQVAAIAAVQQLSPQSPALEELRLWLLQSKRSQHWRTREETMDAIYALLSRPENNSLSLTSHTAPLHVVARHKGVPLPPLSTESGQPPQVGVAAYGRANYDTLATEIAIDKTDGGKAWGSVYAISIVPSKSVTVSRSGLAVERSFERIKGDQRVPLTAGESVERGERIQVIYRLVAERNYDFVVLRAPRPVGCVPTQPLSGYEWSKMGSLYKVVQDTGSDCFIEHLSKGKHLWAEEWRTDRAGRFTVAPSRLQSVYAPEFIGTSESATLHVGEPQ